MYISKITDGFKTITSAGQRETLVSVSTPAQYVYITGRSTNTGRIMIGGSTVVADIGSSARGVPVNPGKTIPFPVPGGDLLNIYLDTEFSGDGVLIMYLT